MRARLAVVGFFYTAALWLVFSDGDIMPSAAGMWPLLGVLVVAMAARARTSLAGRNCCARLAESGASVSEVARHEAGHYESAKHRGSTGVRAELRSFGGVTYTSSDRSALDAAVITAAGTEATNARGFVNWSTTSDDAKRLKQECREAGITPDEAIRLARKDVSRLSGRINRTAAELETKRRV